MRVGALQAYLVGAPTTAPSRLRWFVWICLLGAGLLVAPDSLQARQIQAHGRTYLELSQVGKRLGMRAYWLKGYKTYRLRSQWTTLDFGKKSRVVTINGMPAHLGFPTVVSGSDLFIAEADFRHLVQPLLTPQIFAEPPELKRIVIDPGHGGQDSGALGGGGTLQEKDLTLEVSLRLKVLLEGAGYTVILTRDRDVYVPLAQRPKIANRAGADLFVSIHFNAAASPTASGFETFALTPQFQASSKNHPSTGADARAYAGNAWDPWNSLLAYETQRSLVDHFGGPDRGLKRARFLVLKHVECPAILTELGFVSHAETARQLHSERHLQTLAQSLFEGIVHYHKRLPIPR